MKKPFPTLFFSLFFMATAAQAQVSATDAWIRATVPQQRATGAFMQLESKEGAKLLAAKSPIAAVVEVHSMIMESGVMKMRAVPFLDLPAGKPVELKPGGYHVMLMDLKGQVNVGDVVPVTLIIEDRAGQRQTLEVSASARMVTKSVDQGMHKTHQKQEGHKH
jgi:copper(I)-binding protein